MRPTQQELHVIEEDDYLLWGLITLVCTAGGTYLLAGSFLFVNWQWFNFDQIAALLLFLLSFVGIFKISEPLYRFTFRFEEQTLVIDIAKGSLPVETLRIQSEDLAALKFAPDSPRDPAEALFDFSRTYHLMWRKKGDASFQKLLAVESSNIILKVNDIADIMNYIKQRVPGVHIPPEQAEYFNL